MIHGEIKETFEEIGVPVSFHRYKGTGDTYLIFFQHNERAVMHWNDQEQATRYYFQVNIFSKHDYSDLLRQVKEKIKKLGGTRTYETDVYADEDYYQRVIRFTITRKNKGDN